MDNSTEKPWAVDMLESERGWGNRIDETVRFETEELAQAYVTEYNTRFNSSPTVPDWYMVALSPVYRPIKA